MDLNISSLKWCSLNNCNWCVSLDTAYILARCVHTSDFCLPFYDGDKIGRAFKRATFDLDMLISFDAAKRPSSLVGCCVNNGVTR